jgi:hypothetical protein
MVIYTIIFCIYTYFIVVDLDIFFDILKYCLTLCLYSIFNIVIVIKKPTTISLLIRMLLLLVLFFPVTYFALPFVLYISGLLNQILLLPVIWSVKVWALREDELFIIMTNYKKKLSRIFWGIIIGGIFAFLLLLPRFLSESIGSELIGDFAVILLGSVDANF